MISLEESFVVYVLYSPSHEKIYIGYTSDLINRMKSHNHFGKGDFTSKYRPWIVLHLEFFETKSEAMKREKQLKSAKGREFIYKLITEVYESSGFISASKRTGARLPVSLLSHATGVIFF